MHYFLISIIIVIDLENIVRHSRPHVPFLPTRVNLLLFRTRVLFCPKAINLEFVVEWYRVIWYIYHQQGSSQYICAEIPTSWTSVLVSP